MCLHIQYCIRQDSNLFLSSLSPTGRGELRPTAGVPAATVAEYRSGTAEYRRRRSLATQSLHTHVARPWPGAPSRLGFRPSTSAYRVLSVGNPDGSRPIRACGEEERGINKSPRPAQGNFLEGAFI